MPPRADTVVLRVRLHNCAPFPLRISLLATSRDLYRAVLVHASSRTDLRPAFLYVDNRYLHPTRDSLLRHGLTEHSRTVRDSEVRRRLRPHEKVLIR